MVPTPGLSQGPSASSECGLLPAAIRGTLPGIQQGINTVLEKQSTLTVLLRLFLSRGYNRSTKRLVPTWDGVGGGEEGGAAPRWLSYQQRWHLRGYIRQGQGWNRPGPNAGGRDSQKGARKPPPYPLKAPSLSLFLFQSRESATLDTLPEAWVGILGICCANAAALTTLNEGIQQCGNN